MADADETLGLPADLQAAILAGPQGMSEQVAYAIWGSVVTATRGFGRAEIRIDSNIQRVFVAVTLRPWTRSKRLKILHDAWLKKAETRAKEHLPQGWRLLVYYEQKPGSAGEAGGRAT